ncbi:hypothetical protein LSTR_LSTR003023 [Laodelphax striatellus]|uniref:Uncharacterized protein n=1 Tax=Laodelphax striatellus TaxID=195883 RepID=A0A482XU78_LAOST|nr:hypothetical protein LSTR_LSTR003023 [Laodelphax striatellus]
MLSQGVWITYFLIAINVFIGLHGASLNMDFMKNPDFPGNRRWMDNLRKSLPSNNENFPGTAKWQEEFGRKMNNGNFPGSARWREEFEREMSETLDMPQPMVPCFPEHFPHPPKCEPVANPGFKYPEVSVKINQEYRIEHNSFLCSDPDYGEESFYMLQTAVVVDEKPTISRTETSHFYNKNGEPIAYSSKVRMIPANENCS